MKGEREMALQVCALNLDQSLRELQPHGTLDFPCAGYASFYTRKSEAGILWHWHEELEIIYAKDGSMQFKVPSVSCQVQEGDLFLVNSNILHSGITENTCFLQSLVFHPDLITGNQNSVFAKKYLLPLINCPSFSGVLIPKGECPRVTDAFCRAFEAMEKEPFGFEFTVREKLSEIGLFLAEKFHEDLDFTNHVQSQDNLRMRRMLTFIHENYPEEITLAQIAKAADIGERECLRCFRKTIQSSPIQYLLKYRIMQGADQLLRQPESSISEIALSCGFVSPSNFSKVFRRFYNCTPREYRRDAADPSRFPAQNLIR